VNEDAGRRTVPGFVTNAIPGPADENGQLLNFRITLSNRQGTLEFVGDVPTIDPNTGSLVFEPKPNTNGSVVVQVRLEDNGGTALGGENTFPVPPADPVSFTITVNAVNDAPEFTKGVNETIPEDVGLRTVAWATGIRPGPTTALDEQNQSVSFNVILAQPMTGNLGFTTLPSIDPATGVLTYQTALHTNGQAIFRVSLTDSGLSNPPNSNTSATQTFTITVTPVNDPPEFTLAGSTIVDEDAGLQTVANFINGIRPGPVQATDESTGQTAQALAVQVTRIPPPIPSPNDLAFSNLPAIDLATGTLTYQAQANSNGSAVFRVRMTDSGSNLQPNVNFSDQTFTITVNAINDPPSFTKGANVVVNEDSGAQSVANWATNIVAGPPNETAQAPTLAFTATVVSTTRSLAFSAAPEVSPDGTLTFTARANTNGVAVVHVSLSDSGNGTPPNDNTSDDQTFTISVSAVNDPPQLVNGVADFAVNEDSPMTVVELFPSVFADIDVNQFDGDILSLRVISNTQVLTTQLDTTQITATTTSANLRLTYLPNRSGTVELIVEATDISGTSVQDTFTVTVNAVNDAPVIGGPTIANPNLFQPAEEVLTQLSGLTIDDVDATENVGGKLNVVMSVGHGTLTFATNVAGGLTQNDVTANGSSSVSINATPAALNATLNAANGLRYLGLPDFNGPDQLSITVNDNGNSPSNPLSAVATLNFSVSAVNDSPIAGPDFVTTPEDTVLIFASSTLRTNDTAGPPNENGQTLTVISVSTIPSTTGTVTLQGGNVVYTPRVDFVGTDVFTYTIEDNGQTNGSAAPRSTVGSVTVTITAVNDPPTPEPDAQTTPEDVTLVFDAAQLLVKSPPCPACDDKPGAIDPTTRQLRSVDEAGQILTVIGVGSNSSQGGAVALISGSVQYTPPANFFGSDTFTYIVQDNGTTNGVSDPKQSIGTVTVTVTAVNDDPIAVSDTRSGREGTPLVFNASELAANDSPGPNESSQTLTVDAGSSTSANGGTVTLNGGIITYNPPRDFNGSDTFTYTLRDSGTSGANDRKSAIGTVTVNVSEVNNPPVAFADSLATAEDTSLVVAASSLTANDSRGPANESGQALTITSVSAVSAQGGSVVLNSGTGQITYSPAANFNGLDTFVYTVTDNGTTNGAPDPKTAVATVTVTVTDTNDPPVAFADSANASEDTAMTLAASVLLANDTRGPANENSQSLTVISVGAASQAGGTVTLVGGVITYTPPLDFNGVDSFSYTIRDDGSSNGSADFNTAVGLVNVSVSSVNDAPIGTSDLFAAAEDTPLDLPTSDMTLNDLPGPANESTQALTVTGVSAFSSRGGTVSLSNGRVLYTPPADFSGRDTFTYTFQDNGTTNGQLDAKSAVATVSVDVTAQNDPPVTVGDAYAIDEDSRLIVVGNGVLANDFDRDPPPQVLSVFNPGSITASSRGAILTVNSDGSFTYDPSQAEQLQSLRPGQTFQDTFVYQATDGTDVSASATVSITVSGRNDQPTAINDTFSVSEDVTLNVTSQDGVIKNDTDPEGAILTATLVSSVSNGVLTLRPDGSFSYTPRNNFSGQDSFVYRVGDGAASSDAATATINVTAQNDPPIANSDQYSVSRDGTLTVTTTTGVLVNDTDDGVGALTARLVQNTSHGQLTLNNNGSFTYRPTVGFAGTDTFTYRAVDSNNVQSDLTATVTITVENTRPWQNPRNALDVNNDTVVSAIDALQIINRLNSDGPHVLASPPDAPPPPFVDTNGDGSLSPIDALLVINFLNGQTTGEGEASLPIADGAFSTGDSQVIAMPMTSGQGSIAESSAQSRVSTRVNASDLYFADLSSEETKASNDSTSESSMNAFDDEDSLDDLLNGLFTDSGP
jgi:VCBS repeat-containing protein